MKVLLVSPNVESLPDPVFPIGLAQIAGVLGENGIVYEILDLCFEKNYKDAISSSISAFQPDIIGLSLRNLDNVSYPNYISYLPFYKKVIQTIREHSTGLIVAAGSGFSLLPETVLQHIGADVGIVGEGEHEFIKLLKEVEKKEKLKRTPPSGIFEEQTGVIHDITSLPLPDRTRFDNEAYMRFGGMGNIQSKRGCPFNCVYCTYPVIEGKSVRVREPKQVCDEIEGMLELGIDNIFFVDNTFNFPIEHAVGICKEILSRELSFKWSCYANPGYISSELIELMLKSGCTGIEFGSDAAHDTMLLNLCKNFSVNDLKRASEICHNLSMPFCHSLLLGGPGETMETVNQSLETILDISATAAICMIGIRVFPKTRLSIIAKGEGLIGADEDYLRPVFYISPLIEKEILPFIERFSKENPTWIFPGLNINMDEQLQKKLRRFGIKGPLWEYMKMSERFRKK